MTLVGFLDAGKLTTDGSTSQQDKENAGTNSKTEQANLCRIIRYIAPSNYMLGKFTVKLCSFPKCLICMNN